MHVHGRWDKLPAIQYQGTPVPSFILGTLPFEYDVRAFVDQSGFDSVPLKFEERAWFLEDRRQFLTSRRYECTRYQAYII